MPTKDDILRKRAEKNAAKAREYARKARGAEKALSERERKRDTRRKIIDGAHIQTEAITNPDIAALLQRLRAEKLVLDDDRDLFGLPPLSDLEKMARGVFIAPVEADTKREADASPPPDTAIQESEAA